MAHRKWLFLSNPFLTEGKKSFKKAYELAKFTDSALAAHVSDPFIAVLYANFHPQYVTLESEYSDWLSQGGIQKGSTLTLDQLLVQLGSGDTDLGIPSLINQWNVTVQGTYIKGSPQYTAIFPQGNAPFTKGDKDTRIAAVSALSATLVGYPGLATLKTTVDAFLASLNGARATQQGQISDTGSDSDDVRQAVQTAMVGMFAVYGGLISQYAGTPEVLESFFDLEKLRDLPQQEWMAAVAPVTTKNIFKRTLDNNRRVKITNLIDRDLKFFVASEKNDTISGGAKTVAALEDEIFTWSELKQQADASYFNVYNDTTDVEGHFKVELLSEEE